MKELIFVTGNQKKLKEAQGILRDTCKVFSLTESKLEAKWVENKNSFIGNAMVKAKSVVFQTKKWVMADDSGLEVDALEGAPGVYSARYAGENASDLDNVNKLLNELGNTSKRNARFKTAIVFYRNGLSYVFEGSIEGKITKEKRGENGFGYDPVFIPNGFDLTFAEMTPEQKNELSHRGKALQKLRLFLERD